MGRDSEAVPAVDRHDRVEERGQFGRVEVLGRGVVRTVDVAVATELRERLRELEGGALAIAEQRRFAPRGDGEQPALALARRKRFLRMQVDAVGAAVELRGAELDEV